MVHGLRADEGVAERGQQGDHHAQDGQPGKSPDRSSAMGGIHGGINIQSTARQDHTDHGNDQQTAGGDVEEHGDGGVCGQGAVQAIPDYRRIPDDHTNSSGVNDNPPAHWHACLITHGSCDHYDDPGQEDSRHQGMPAGTFPQWDIQGCRAGGNLNLPGAWG